MKVTELGKEVLYGRKKADLAIIAREDLRVKGRKRRARRAELIEPMANHDGKSEEKILFERLRELRRQIADANHWPAYIVMSDKSLHAIATERPTTLRDFGDIFGIGEHKRDAYGEQFIAVIKEYSEREIVSIQKETLPMEKEAKALSYMDQQKQLYAKAYAPWTEDDDNRLKRLYVEGKSIAELGKIFERNKGAIRSRLKKMGINY